MLTSPMRVTVRSFIAALLTTAFCYDASSQRSPSEAARKQQVQNERKNCDFSDRHPLRMSSDWLWRGGIVKRVEPVYPIKAKHRHIRGRIPVRVLINRNGEVERACGSGQRLLRESAEAAARQWIFLTPQLNGQKISYVEETIVFDFVLDQ